DEVEVKVAEVLEALFEHGGCAAIEREGSAGPVRVLQDEIGEREGSAGGHGVCSGACRWAGDLKAPTARCGLGRRPRSRSTAAPTLWFLARVLLREPQCLVGSLLGLVGGLLSLVSRLLRVVALLGLLGERLLDRA